MEQLRKRDVEAIGADLYLEPEFVDAVVDLRFPNQILSVLSKVKPDVVINLGYLLTRELHADVQNAVHTNVLGVNGVFDAPATLGIPRVIFASSNPVFGDQSDFGEEEITEESPRHPRVLYALMKQFNEDMAAFYNRTSETTIVTVILSSLHGRGKGGIFNPLDMLIEAAGATNRFTLPWSAMHEFSFLHVDDSANIFVELALAPELRWTVYNSGGECMTMQRLAHLAAPLCGLEIDFEEPGWQLAHCSRLNWDRLRTELPVTRRSPQEWLRFELERAGKL
jgi:nucleoside-diphosphate-sugar epimerase